MNLVYPLKAILIYFAILFAPPDVDRIAVEGFPGSDPVQLVRNGQNWEAGGNAVSISDGNLVTQGPAGKESLKIGDFAASPEGHDWGKQPAFTLGDATTMEKTASGFICRRTSPSGEMNGVYQIRYVRPDSAAAISINVFGEVKVPGVYRIPASGSLADAIAAAGGWTARANLKKTTVVRGPAGEVPAVTEHDVNAILKGTAASPLLQERDTICVPESLF